MTPVSAIGRCIGEAATDVVGIAVCPGELWLLQRAAEQKVIVGQRRTPFLAALATANDPTVAWTSVP